MSGSYCIGDFTYDKRRGTETNYEPIYDNEWHGVDCIPVIVGRRPIEKNRWSRTCKICGKVEYTYAIVPVKYEPVFK